MIAACSWACWARPRSGSLLILLAAVRTPGRQHLKCAAPTQIGAVASGPRVVNDETRARMKEILADIQSGQFARQWIAENEAGKGQYEAWLKADYEHPIEQTGARLRERMAWLNTAKPEAA